MAEQWYYRLFGQDFGPVSIEELQSLFDLNSLSATDEVRLVTSDTWVVASSISYLRVGSLPTISLKPLSSPIEVTKSAGAHDWYYRFLDQEFGPLDLEEIVAFAERGQLSADDVVKLGVSGKWRRVGSIGRMAAVLPFQSLSPPIPVPHEVSSAAAVIGRSGPKLAKVTPAPVRETAMAADASLLAQAQSAYNAAEQKAHALIAWGFAPNVDPAWWGWISGVEYGPVGFRNVWEWAKTGKLRPTDFVRNGAYGQYAPTANVSGLMEAANMIAHATVALNESKADAEAVRATFASSVSSETNAPSAICFITGRTGHLTTRPRAVA